MDYDRTRRHQAFLCHGAGPVHFAVHGHTAAELIMERADIEGSHGPDFSRTRRTARSKSDVSIAKNYLTEEGAWAAEPHGHLI
ncbi:MAG: RhuM family protein [Christensenellales bacterium]